MRTTCEHDFSKVGLVRVGIHDLFLELYTPTCIFKSESPFSPSRLQKPTRSFQYSRYWKQKYVH